MSQEILHRGEAMLSDLKGGMAALGLGVGNVYYVIKTTETHYNTFVEEHECEYADGSSSIHNTIQSALDACVANRNDYVIVMPSEADYDLTVTLTLSKRSVHLICPAGMGMSNGASGSCRIHQTGAYPVMVVSANGVEIAGFYLKNYYSKGGIILTDTCWSSHIHHNYFAMYLDTATNEPMLGPYLANTTGSAGAWATYEHNFFQSQAGGSATIAAIIHFNAQATGVRVIHNDIQIGDTNNTATVGIDNLSVKGIVSDNNFYAAQTSTGAGVFTKCVRIDASGCAYGNRANVVDGAIVNGGTDEKSFVNNQNSVAGGTVDEL
jgi:hypothetical protein